MSKRITFIGLGIFWLFSLILVYQGNFRAGVISIVLHILAWVILFGASGNWRKVGLSIVLILNMIITYSGYRILFRSAQQSVVNTEILSYAEALEKAKKLNRPVFIDFHSPWCRPCVDYTNQVLTDSEVGEKLNKTFVNLKLDNLSVTGEAWIERFNISRFPTYLVLNTEGKVIEMIYNLDKKSTLLLAARYAP